MGKMGNDHFTYQEKARLKNVYGTESTRVGADSQQQFGSCCLCLHLAQSPMVSPSGHLYCRECIYSYILMKTQELKEEREAYEAQIGEHAQRELEAEAKAEGTRVKAFAGGSSLALVEHKKKTTAVESVAAAAAATALAGVAKEALEEKERAEIIKSLKREVIDHTKEEKVQQLRNSSPWLPVFQPTRGEVILSAPEKRPRSPMSGKPLRTKELSVATFTFDESKDGAGGGARNKGSILCPVTRKEISSQEVVLLKKSGHIMLKDALRQFGFPTMTCPVSDVPFKKKDVIDLVRDSTSFAARGNVEAKKYGATMRS